MGEVSPVTIIEFQQGDMSGLNFEDGALGGIVSFYSIIHIPRDEIVGALREMNCGVFAFYPSC